MYSGQKLLPEINGKKSVSVAVSGQHFLAQQVAHQRIQGPSLGHTLDFMHVRMYALAA